MGTINISELKPGMVLEKPVYSPQGALLLPEGAELTDRNIFVLKTWGVTEVDIKGVEKEETHTTLSPEQEKEIDEEIKKKFYHWDTENEFAKEIIRIAKKIKISSV